LPHLQGISNIAKVWLRDEIPYESAAEEETAHPEDTSNRRLRDSMLGDSKRGLSVEEIAQLTGYAVNTVRSYLYGGRRKVLGDAIRDNEEGRVRALAIILDKRKVD
jgi:hypothetical protein